MFKKQGFTLIELLVSISIIVLLTSVAVVYYQQAGKKARDNKREADLEQIRSALEMYRSDNGSYPTGDWGTMTNTLISGNYLGEVPTDPKGYSYYYNRITTTTYELCAYKETGGSDSCTGGSNNCGSVSCNYKVENP
jgi:general secretion pathway protein G